jgi:hypothetical protein
LLRSGSTHDADKPGVPGVVENLQDLGLIEVASFEYVRCADSRDRDYRYVHNRSCHGRTRLYEDLDDDEELDCPECSRRVYPRGKRRHRAIQVRVKSDGIHALLEKALVQTGFEWKLLCPWVWRVDTPQGEAKLIVVDHCDPEYGSRDWAMSNRACYVVVDAASCRARFLPEEWLTWTRLADVVCQPDILAGLLSSAATAEVSPEVRVSVPVYSAITHPVVLGTPASEKKTSTPKKPPKRAPRAAAIDAVKRALREHLRAARDHAYSLRERGKDPELLPRPTLEQLAAELGVHFSSVSRAINDRSDREITILWETANDLDQIMRFKG